ncbi:MAG TPA: hypothetical protein VG675_10930 [Bryobacteraceae bacterium]|nr:hypothetical protein [Bryobacteraceae bacterium]
MSGYKLKDIVALAKQPDRGRLVTHNICGILSAVDRLDDGLTGAWTLTRWDYEYGQHKKPFFVTGSLAVLYPTIPDQEWAGRMFLEYRRFRDGVPLLFRANGRLAHFVGACISGVYAVTLRRGQDGHLEGASKTISVLPDRHIPDTGRFFDVSLANTTLTGRFANVGHTAGGADFQFAMRSRWKQVLEEAALLGKS